MDAHKRRDGEAGFEREIRALETEIANAGAHLTIDSTARMAYTKEIARMSAVLHSRAAMGEITWAEAAIQAQQTRNLVMETIRARSSPVGRALTQQLKFNGRTLNELIARQCAKMYGGGAVFSQLPTSRQQAVYAQIVVSAGRSNPKITLAMSRLLYAGRGVLFLSLSLSVYNVAIASDKSTAVAKELAASGSGIAGGIAGGALAGVACGPGAPVCVTVGAFVGGALAAFGTSFFW